MAAALNSSILQHFYMMMLDKGKTRRGQRSVNDIGIINLAVLLGDFMFSKSFQLMTEGKS